MTAAELVRLMANREVAEHYPTPASTRPARSSFASSACDGGRLEDISFVLHRGEILGIAGLVGAGRSGWRARSWARTRVAERRIVIAGSAVAIDSPPLPCGRDRVPARGSKAAGPGPAAVGGAEHVAVAPRRAVRGSACSTALKERGEAEDSIASLRIRTPGPISWW